MLRKAFVEERVKKGKEATRNKGAGRKRRERAWLEERREMKVLDGAKEKVEKNK